MQGGQPACHELVAAWPLLHANGDEEVLDDGRRLWHVLQISSEKDTARKLGEGDGLVAVGLDDVPHET